MLAYRLNYALPFSGPALRAIRNHPRFRRTLNDPVAAHPEASIRGISGRHHTAISQACGAALKFRNIRCRARLTASKEQCDSIRKSIAAASKYKSQPNPILVRGRIAGCTSPCAFEPLVHLRRAFRTIFGFPIGLRRVRVQ